LSGTLARCAHASYECERIDYTGFGLGWLPLGFAAGIYDTDTGIVRFGRRDLDPPLGRWLTKEPLRFDGGRNFYTYVLADPLNASDPSGLLYGDVGGSFGGSVFGIPLVGVGGVFIDSCGNLCYYLGGGFGTPGGEGHIGLGSDDVTPGLGGGITAGLEFVYVQGGGANGEPFLEGGVSTSVLPQLSATSYYTWCP